MCRQRENDFPMAQTRGIFWISAFAAPGISWVWASTKIRFCPHKLKTMTTPLVWAIGILFSRQLHCRTKYKKKILLNYFYKWRGTYVSFNYNFESYRYLSIKDRKNMNTFHFNKIVAIVNNKSVHSTTKTTITDIWEFKSSTRYSHYFK